MSDMPALCAALGSFHVKSSSTSLAMFLVMVRVLPFFLTVTFTCSDTLMVSSFGVRWYTDQRYSSMQASAMRHASGLAAGLADPFAGSGVGSGVPAAAAGTGGVSDGGMGTRKAAP